MSVIYKYPMEITDFQEIEMPEGAEILCVQTADLPYGHDWVSGPTLWAMVDPDKPLKPRRFYVFGTGKPMKYEHKLKYIGTTQQNNGALVWHIFENVIEMFDDKLFEV